MKLLSSILAFTFAGSAFAQNAKLPMSDETKLITYTSVVQAQGIEKADLYDKAFAWLSAYYKNPSDVLKEKDRDGANMLVKARFKINNPPDKKNNVTTQAGDVQYSLKLDFKDGKFRYTLTDINWKQLSYFPAEKWMDKSNQYYSPNWDYYLKQTDDNCKKIIEDLEKSMTTVKAEKKDEW